MRYFGDFIETRKRSFIIYLSIDMTAHLIF